MEAALELVRLHIDFKIDAKVHVFEVVIRALGGLLSAHTLLLRRPDLIPE